MPITVTTSAASTDMTTVDTVATELGLTASEKTTHTALLTQQIKEASDFIRNYTGRVFAKETVTETLRSRGGQRLVLSRTPIISVSEVRLDGTVVDSTNYEIEDADSGFLFKETGWNSTTLYTGPFVPTPSRKFKYDWAVDYVAGYIMPGESGRNFPYDLEKSCIDIVKYKFQSRSENPNISKEEIGDAAVWYSNKSNASYSYINITGATLDKYAFID